MKYNLQAFLPFATFPWMEGDDSAVAMVQPWPRSSFLNDHSDWSSLLLGLRTSDGEESNVVVWIAESDKTS